MISISLNNISHWIFNPRNFKLVSISNLIICLHFSRLLHFTFLFVSNNKSKNRINFASNRIGKICIFELRTFKWNENENIFVYLLEFMITSSNRSRNGKKSNNNKKNPSSKFAAGRKVQNAFCNQQSSMMWYQKYASFHIHPYFCHVICPPMNFLGLYRARRSLQLWLKLKKRNATVAAVAASDVNKSKSCLSLTNKNAKNSFCSVRTRVRLFVFSHSLSYIVLFRCINCNFDYRN